MKAKRLLLPLVTAIVMMAMYPMRMWAISGSGTSTSHYQITSATDWANSTFQSKLSSSSSSSPVYIDITADFTLTSVTLRDKDVYIVLDGQGHTISLSGVTTSEENTGLFGKIGGGEVKNLHLGGNLTTSKKYMGNLCGKVTGTLTISNVLCSASLTNTSSGDATAGGFIGQIEGNVTFNNCGFTYKFYGKTGTTRMCGMVGYRSSGTVVFNNCFCKAVWDNVTSGENYAYMRNDKDNTTYNNSYYVNCGEGGKATDKSSGGPTQITDTGIFSTGELAYKLNGSSNGVARWYQNLDNGSTEGYPFPYTTSASSHGKVYYGSFHGTTKYSNYSHTLTKTDAKAQTCSTDGNIQYWTCNCYEGNGKNYTNTAGTITTNSVTLAKYNHIGHGKGYTATYDWAGSSYSSGSCKATLKCNNCNTNVESNKALTVTQKSHTDVSCTVDGSTTYSASGSNATYSFTYASTSQAFTKTKLGHDFTVNSETYKKSDATCTADAVYYKICSRCSVKGTDTDTWTKTSTALGHDFDKINDPNQTVCTRKGCNHTWLYYTAAEKVTPKTPASLSGYSESNNTFSNGKGKIEFASKLTSIGQSAFYKTSLTSVTIPNSVTSIGGNAFSYSSLTSVTIPNSVTSICNSAFSHTSLTSVTIPNSVTSIDDNAFRECSVLTSVTIQDAATSIGKYAFLKCTKLSALSLGSKVTCIGLSAFKNCSSLTSVIIPNSVTSIGDNAFSYSSLTSVIIPNSVTSIETYAFYEDANLSDVTLESSTKLGYPSGLFSPGYLNGMTLRVPSNLVSSYKEASGWMNFSLIRCISHTPSHVSAVDATSTTAGNIEHYHCDYCGNYSDEACTTYVADVTIPATGGGSSTEPSTKLSLTYDNGLAGVSSDEAPSKLFDGIYSTKYCVDASNGPWVEFHASTPSTISGYAIVTGNDTNGSNSGRIPHSWTLYGKVNSTDANWTQIVSVESDNTITATNTKRFEFTLPSATTTAYQYFRFVVQNAAHSGALEMGEIELMGSAVEVAACSHTNLTLHDAKEASCTDGNTKYWECTLCHKYFSDANANTEITDISTVVIAGAGHKFAENDLTRDKCTICDHGFFRYSSIGNAAVDPYDKNELKDGDGYLLEIISNDYDTTEGKCVMEFNKPLVTIGEDAFNHCYFTGALIIPNSITTIGNYAFRCCYNLTSVTIPNTVTTIGEYAFSSDANLSDVTLESSTLLNYPYCLFSSKYLNGMTLRVPSSLVSSYQAADGWKNFGKIYCITHAEVSNGHCMVCGEKDASIKRGDINADGSITIEDLTLLISILNGNKISTKGSADVDSDGSITTGDIEKLQNIILGLHDEITVEEDFADCNTGSSSLIYKTDINDDISFSVNTDHTLSNDESGIVINFLNQAEILISAKNGKKITKIEYTFEDGVQHDESGSTPGITLNGNTATFTNAAGVDEVKMHYYSDVFAYHSIRLQSVKVTYIDAP